MSINANGERHFSKLCSKWENRDSYLLLRGDGSLPPTKPSKPSKQQANKADILEMLPDEPPPQRGEFIVCVKCQ